MTRLSRLAVTAGLVLGLLISGCQSPEVNGPYLGQDSPGQEPVRFAGSVVGSQAHSVTVFSPDGQMCCWGSMNGARWSDARSIKCTELVDGLWAAPVSPDFTQADDSPTFSADGTRLYFTSGRGEEGGKESIWFVETTADGWSDPVRLPEAVNSLYIHWQLSLTAAGDLYFGASDINGGRSDIYMAELVDGEYTKVTRLEEDSINTTYGEFSPYVARDGSYLIFSRIEGDANLYISYRNPDGSWGEATKLPGPINGPAEDHGAWVSEDGKYLFFVSTRSGGSKVFWVDAGVIEELRPR